MQLLQLLQSEVARQKDKAASGSESRGACAAAFTKSFLDLEGELTPILVSLVSKDQQAHSMLDSSGVKLSKTVQVSGPAFSFSNKKALAVSVSCVPYAGISCVPYGGISCVPYGAMSRA